MSFIIVEYTNTFRRIISSHVCIMLKYEDTETELWELQWVYIHTLEGLQLP